ncbi:MAG: hypothetical protein QOE92_136 [Chloroflexota bacterium]|jgi:hypothetical protein|nr:hypothetical protein [Chloroflexota bacterium]
MREIDPGVRQAARRLGRDIAPDLAQAAAAVERRAGRTAATRRTRRGAWLRASPLAAVAVAALVALPVLASHGATAPSPSVTGAPVAAAPPTGVEAVRGDPAPDAAAYAPAVTLTQPAVPVPAGAGPLPACGDGDLLVETAFDRDAYAFGSASVVTLVLDNTAERACRVDTDPCASGIRVADVTGAIVYDSEATHPYVCQGAGGAAPAGAVSGALAPGQRMSLSFTWALQGCGASVAGAACRELSVGRYEVTGFWARTPGADAPPVRSLPRHLVVA